MRYGDNMTEDARKTIDEVVAFNMRRLRKVRRIPQVELAKRLDVSRHHIYEMEGRRSDRRQREFRWSEIVALCEALSTNVYELVLPQPDVHVNMIYASGPDMWAVRVMGREEMAKALFGRKVPDLALETFEKESTTKEQRRERLVQEMTEMFEHYLEEMEEE